MKNGMKIFLGAILFASISLPSLAQCGMITGRISDSTSGKSIINAVLHLKNDSTNIPAITTLSDIDGQYEFKPLSKGKYSLEVNYCRRVVIIVGIVVRQEQDVHYNILFPALFKRPLALVDTFYKYWAPKKITQEDWYRVGEEQRLEPSRGK